MKRWDLKLTFNSSTRGPHTAIPEYFDHRIISPRVGRRCAPTERMLCLDKSEALATSMFMSMHTNMYEHGYGHACLDASSPPQPRSTQTAPHPRPSPPPPPPAPGAPTLAKRSRTSPARPLGFVPRLHLRGVRTSEHHPGPRRWIPRRCPRPRRSQRRHRHCHQL